VSIVVNDKVKLTYREYRHFPDDGRRHEVIDGDHYVSPAPETYHQTLSSRILVQLYRQIVEAGKGVVFHAPTDVELSQVDIVQPDLLCIRHERRFIVSPSRVVGTPDLIVEILSPTNRPHDLELKRAMYERTGVPEYWIVDPADHTVTALVLEGHQYREEGVHADRAESVSFPGVAIDLTRVW
jgi:Uma2 family endonuclease